MTNVLGQPCPTKQLFPSAISWMKYTNAPVILSSWNTGSAFHRTPAPGEGSQEAAAPAEAWRDQDPHSQGKPPLPACPSSSLPSAGNWGKNSREKRLSSRDQAFFWAMGGILVAVCLGGKPKPKILSDEISVVPSLPALGSYEDPLSPSFLVYQKSTCSTIYQQN